MRHVALLIVILLIGAGSNGGFQSLASCYETNGEVVAKEDDNGLYMLYVKLDYQNEQKKYRVFVGPETYDEYEIGHLYTDTTCELDEYEAIQEVINELLTWGIIEGVPV